MTVASSSRSNQAWAPILIQVKAFRPNVSIPATRNCFVESDGYVSLEAEHYSTRRDVGGMGWRKIDGYGRTLSSMAVFPVTAPSTGSGRNAPCLEYRMYLFDTGTVNVHTITAPSLDFTPRHPLRFAVSFDDQAPQVIALPSQKELQTWANAVRNNAFTLSSRHTIAGPGIHTLKIWMVDPGVVLQKIVVDLGGVRPSYLGPAESTRRTPGR